MGIRRCGDHWLWVGGPVPPGFDAVTVGTVVSVRRAAAGDQRLLAHERQHVRQWRELGALGFLARYLGGYLRWRRQGCGHVEAYRRIPLEVEAELLSAGEAGQLGESNQSSPRPPGSPV